MYYYKRNIQYQINVPEDETTIGIALNDKDCILYAENSYIYFYIYQNAHGSKHNIDFKDLTAYTRTGRDGHNKFSHTFSKAGYYSVVI